MKWGSLHRPQAAESKRDSVEATELSKDEIFDVLSNHRRRRTLHYLRRHGGAASIGDLSETIAARENDASVEAITSDERKRVYTSLQQFHLPKMNKRGIIEYDRRAGTVELDDAMANVNVYLDVVPENDVSWSQYYIGLSALYGVLFGLVALDLFPFTLVPDVGWLFVSFVLFAGSALVHRYRERCRGRIGATDLPP